MPTNIIKVPVTMPDNNWPQVRTQVIEPIDLVEGLLENPTDMVGEFPTEEADGNQYSFFAWRKKAGYKGAVDWDKNDFNTAEKLDKLEMAQKTVIIEGEIIAGVQMKTIDLESKGGKAIKTLTAHTEAVVDDMRWGIYNRVKAGMFQTLQPLEVADDTIEALIAGMQTVYETLIRQQLIRQNMKEGWSWYVNEKTFDTIFGLNQTFTALAPTGGANTDLFQGIVWGLNDATKKSIKFHGIPFKIIDDVNFQDADGEVQYKCFVMNPNKFGRLVWIADGVGGGIWTYPLNSDTKDDLTGMKGKASVQFVPHVYVYDPNNEVAGDKSPFAWGLNVKKPTP